MTVVQALNVSKPSMRHCYEISAVGYIFSIKNLVDKKPRTINFRSNIVVPLLAANTSGFTVV